MIIIQKCKREIAKPDRASWKCLYRFGNARVAGGFSFKTRSFIQIRALRRLCRRLVHEAARTAESAMARTRCHAASTTWI
jgi:hypothetical protein